MRPEQDKAIVVSFDTSAELVADLTDDTQKLEQGDPRAAAGRRHGAVRRDLLRLPRQADAGSAAHKFRRAMVVLSDGDDNQSRYTRDQALEMAQKADVVIYTISTNITPRSKPTATRS